MKRQRNWNGFILVFTVMMLCIGIASCGSSDGGSPPAVDTDGDGLTDQAERNIYGTSPLLADTDGDGLSDAAELEDYDPSNNRYVSNPLIADVPRIDIQLKSAPAVMLDFVTTDGTSNSVSTERSATSSQSVGISNTTTSSRSIEKTHSVNVDAELQMQAGVFPTWSVSAGYGFEYATKQENTFSWSSEQTRENQVALAKSNSFEESHAVQTSGGSLALTMDVTNIGSRAFTLTSLYLGAALPDPADSSRFIPIGNLAFDSPDGFPETTLSAGQSAALWTFKNSSLDLTTAKRILNNYTGLIVKISSYEMVKIDGTSFAFDYDSIGQKAATVLIDYGDYLPSERYMVATRADPDNPSVTAGKVMNDYLAIPYTAELTAGVNSIRSLEADQSKKGKWLVVHIYYDGSETLVKTYDAAAEAYDFDNIALKAGNVLQLVYVEDKDGDGLYSREEFLYGSSDSDVDGDTDGDGLGDYAEIYTYGTGPGLFDSDFDGLNDGADTNKLIQDSYHISAGEYYTVAVKTDGSLLAWGDNREYQLGTTTLETCGANNAPCSLGPIQIYTPGVDWASIGAGFSHTVGLSADYSLHGWGINIHGEAGIGDSLTTPVQTPTLVDAANWKLVAAGQYHSLSIDDSGRLFAWGNDSYGQLGMITTEMCAAQPCSTAPALVNADQDWAQISAGRQHSMALKADGSLWAWGYNANGELGLGTTPVETCGTYSCSEIPRRVGTASDWIQVSSGAYHTAAIKSDGSLWTWGWNAYGQLGNSFTANKSSPVQVCRDHACTQFDHDWAAVAAGTHHTLAIKTDGSLWAWGYHGSGALGVGTTGWPIEQCLVDGVQKWCSTIPLRIGTETDWVRVSSGSEHSVGVRSDGRIYRWGYNNYGQLGTGNTSSVYTKPVNSDLSLTGLDDMPPVVTITGPANGATWVPVNTVISATFNEPVDCGTVTFTITPPVAGSKVCNPTTASYRPSNDGLAWDQTYTVTIQAGVQDLAGNAMAADKTWSFTTAIAIPAAPSNLSAGLLRKIYEPDGTVINVYGAKWTDNAMNETSFEVWRKDTMCGATDKPWSKAGIRGAASGTGMTLSYSDLTLVEGAIYCYRVRAYNAAGTSDWSNTAQLDR